MDQESFRALLQTSRAGSTTQTASRGSLLAGGTSKKIKNAESSQPAMKPRKVKESKYRDRATERRTGGGNDFAEAEALLQDFEKNNADNADRTAVEEQRKYLGGDSTHSVLVKGLDFALLEQTKAKAAATHDSEDEDELERAFQSTTVTGPITDSSESKKRSRADLLKNLKQTRGPEGGETKGATDGKTTGKFKPIGFKSIEGSVDDKSKKKKKAKTGADGEERKKKKRKVEAVAPHDDALQSEAPPIAGSPKAASLPENPPSRIEPEPVDDDFDIFADAGEYEGVDLGDSDDEAGGLTAKPAVEGPPSSVPRQGGWFDEPEHEDEPEPSPGDAPPIPSSSDIALVTETPVTGDDPAEEGEEIEGPRMVKLQGLSSSTVPSIRDVLEADDALAKEDKRKARREKNKKKAPK